MKTYLIAHGAFGSPDENWFPWLKSELKDACVFVPHFPTPDGQNLNAWLEIASSALKKSSPENTVLIGHSTGALLVLRMAEKTKVPYKAVIAVCPFARPLGLPEFDPLNDSFIKPAFDWKAVERGAKKIVCFAGDNDPYVPLGFSKEIASAVNAEFIVVPQGGHLNAKAGKIQFPELLNRIGGL